MQADMAAYDGHLAARIGRPTRSFSEQDLWARPFGVDRIVVALTGSPSRPIEVGVAATGYDRDKGAESADPARPNTEESLRDFRRAIGMEVRTIRRQGGSGPMSPVAGCGEPVRDRFGSFLACATHVGPMAYLAQALDHKLDEKAW